MICKEKLKEDVEAFRKTKQGKSGIKPRDGWGEQKYWSMLNVHHTVSWWESPPSNGMTSHLLDSFFSDIITISLADRSHHWWIQINVFLQQTQLQHNACGRNQTWCCSRSRYWWKMVPSQQTTNMQRLNQWKIYVKYHRWPWLKIPNCPLQCRSKLHQQDWLLLWILKCYLV